MSKKISDKKNRWRNKTVGFRVSPEEWDVFTDKVKMCGYSKKQDYIMECLMNHTVTAQGNPLMLTQFRRELKKILTELNRIDSKEQLEEAVEAELFAPIATMLEILQAFEKNGK